MDRLRCLLLAPPSHGTRRSSTLRSSKRRRTPRTTFRPLARRSFTTGGKASSWRGHTVSGRAPRGQEGRQTPCSPAALFLTLTPVLPTQDAALIQYTPGYEQDVVDLYKFTRVKNTWMSGEGAPPPSAAPPSQQQQQQQLSPPKAMRRLSPVPSAPDVQAPMFGDDGNIMFE